MWGETHTAMFFVCSVHHGQTGSQIGEGWEGEVDDRKMGLGPDWKDRVREWWMEGVKMKRRETARKAGTVWEMDGGAGGKEKGGMEDRSNDRVRDGRLDGATAFLALSFHDGWCVFFPPYLVCHVWPCTEELCLVTTSEQSGCFSEGWEKKKRNVQSGNPQRWAAKTAMAGAKRGGRKAAAVTFTSLTWLFNDTINIVYINKHFNVICRCSNYSFVFPECLGRHRLPLLQHWAIGAFCDQQHFVLINLFIPYFHRAAPTVTGFN